MAAASADARGSEGRAAGSERPRGGQTWRPDGELLWAVIPVDCHIGTAFHPKGAHGSYSWWLDYASDLGIAFALRGRRKRRQAAAAEKSVLIITGPQGSTAAFYKELRNQMAILLGTAKGLPLANRVFLAQIGLEGLSA